VSLLCAGNIGSVGQKGIWPRLFLACCWIDCF